MEYRLWPNTKASVDNPTNNVGGLFILSLRCKPPRLHPCFLSRAARAARGPRERGNTENVHGDAWCRLGMNVPPTDVGGIGRERLPFLRNPWMFDSCLSFWYGVPR